jgi:acyl carrier protein
MSADAGQAVTEQPARAEHLARLRQFFQQHVPAAATQTLDETTPLLGSGLLDSLSVIQLMVFLGQELHIEIEDEDFTPENLASIGSLLDFVGRKSAGPA